MIMLHETVRKGVSLFLRADPRRVAQYDAETVAAMSRQVSMLLRLEGLAVLVIGIAIYAHLQASWWLFALLFLVPDVSMIGYLKDPKIGATAYNAVHTYVGPALLGGAAFGLASVLAGQIAVIWVCHIGFDRLLGFGLKYPSGFGDTHLRIVNGEQLGRHADDERAARLAAFDELVPEIPTRDRSEVAEELARNREDRRTGGRRSGAP